VTSYAGKTPSETGDVAIYQDAQGSPRISADAKMYFYDFCTYDNAGNLFVDGQDADQRPLIAELPEGSTQFTNLSLQGLAKSFGYPAGILWDGKDLAFGDLDRDVIYRLRVSGAKAIVTGTLELTGAQNVEQFTISGLGRHAHGATLIGPNSSDRSVMFWSYPAGGKPIKAITGLDGAFGTAISKP
jgi:hypothetical protein